MAKSKFELWQEEADMPTFHNGEWVDLETGIPFSAFTMPRQSLSQKAIDARAGAKAFGGKALTGTARQKEWAEKIRAEKLLQMTAEQATMACDPNGILRGAKFWIENRAKTGVEIGAFVETQKELLAQAKALKAAGNAEEFAATAARYNALTLAWGFE